MSTRNSTQQHIAAERLSSSSCPLNPAPTPTPAAWLSGIALAETFLRGDMPTFNEPLEAVPDALAHSDIEGCVMMLAHGDCHDLSIALADAVGVKEVGVVVDKAGIPIHSGLLNEATDQLLDANGVHRTADVLAFWSPLAEGPCKLITMDVEDMCFYSQPDDDTADHVLSHFALIADYVESHLDHLISSHH